MEYRVFRKFIFNIIFFALFAAAFCLFAETHITEKVFAREGFFNIADTFNIIYGSARDSIKQFVWYKSLLVLLFPGLWVINAIILLFCALFRRKGSPILYISISFILAFLFTVVMCFVYASFSGNREAIKNVLTFSELRAIDWSTFDFQDTEQIKEAAFAALYPLCLYMAIIFGGVALFHYISLNSTYIARAALPKFVSGTNRGTTTYVNNYYTPNKKDKNMIYPKI